MHDQPTYLIAVDEPAAIEIAGDLDDCLHGPVEIVDPAALTGRLSDAAGVVIDATDLDSTLLENGFDHGFSTDEDGTGYGLAIVTESRKAHGWVIAVDESAAGGARLTIQH